MKINDRESEVFAVAHVRCIKSGYVISEASGFFYEHEDELYFVTNRHVVIDEEEGYYPEELHLKLHINPNDLQQNRIHKIKLYSENRDPLWCEHPQNQDFKCENELIDIVIILVDKDEIESSFYVNSFRYEDIISNASDFESPHVSVFHEVGPHMLDLLEENGIKFLTIGDSVLVMGYPLGYSDTIHNLPIARNATIASVYSVQFEGMPKIIIDSQLHKGTSGSPVLTNPIVYSNQRNSFQSIISDKKYLVGIHSGEFDRENPSLGLHNVWFASLIPEIITKNSNINIVE